RAWTRDDVYAIRATVSAWIADAGINVIISTGGTGLTGRDGTPEALRVLFDKEIDGFGELFRFISWDKIRTSSLQSRATAGVANGTYLFVLPGSTSACRDAWDELICHQLDYRSRPCNLRSRPLIENLCLHLRPGELVCLLGPSGCGKTTLLRVIAGLESAWGGELTLYDDAGERPIGDLPAELRQIAMIFQDLALYPHLNVRDNVRFALADRKALSEVDDLLSAVSLLDYADRFPHQLSGGQQQRVALARALASRPRILLMDEPFANLDPWLRRPIGIDVKALLAERGISTLLVTHDRDEAFRLGDRVAILANGEIQQIDSPQTLLDQPRNPLVARFIGHNETIRGKVMAGGWATTALGMVTLDFRNAFTPGQNVDVLLRCGDIEITDRGDTCAFVRSRHVRGDSTIYRLNLASGEMVYCRRPNSDGRLLEPGQPVIIQPADRAMPVFPRAQGIQVQYHYPD
ncbi:unnamed protein product, partial [Cyprideis torosa]